MYLTYKNCIPATKQQKNETGKIINYIITITTTNVKCLGINFPKNVQSLYTRN